MLYLTPTITFNKACERKYKLCQKHLVRIMVMNYMDIFSRIDRHKVKFLQFKLKSHTLILWKNVYANIHHSKHAS